MTDHEFDTALITAAFNIAAARGWRHVTVAAAAKDAGLDLSRARARFPARGVILLRFGVLADQAALAEPSPEATVRERLFDLLMRRFDMLQTHRAGVLALLHALPAYPATALVLATATMRSMRWMLDAAGGPTGPRRHMHTHGLMAVWLYAMRAFEKDDSADLSATMSALDKALDRAEQAATWRGIGQSDRPTGQSFPASETVLPSGELEDGAGASPPM